LQPAPEKCRLAATPDNKLLAAIRNTKDANGQDTGDVGVWDIATGRLIAEVPTGPSTRLAWCGDNRTLITADNSFVHLWDIGTVRSTKPPIPMIYLVGVAAENADQRGMQGIDPSMRLDQSK
jgi:WD40 repeat protein